MGFSELASSDMQVTENADLRPRTRSSVTSISSIESFVNDHGVCVRANNPNASVARDRRRSSSAGRERSTFGERSFGGGAEVKRRPASAGWSGGRGPVSSVEDSESLASLANMVEAAVDVATADQKKARRQSDSMKRLMSAGKRPELSRDKATVGQHTLLQQKRLKNDAQSSTRRQSSS